MDANALMQQIASCKHGNFDNPGEYEKMKENRVDVIDLDPYGSSMPFM